MILEKKEIAVIGGGIMQIPLIKDIKRRGFTPVVIDKNPDAPGMLEAGKTIKADISHPDEVITELKNSGIKPDAILTVGTDFTVTTAETATAAGLPGITPETARKATDKIFMRQCFKNHGIPQPDFEPVIAEGDLLKAIRKIGFPLVLKPADSMGARGVKYCASPEEAQAWYPEARDFSKTGRVIAETYIPGQELSIDAVIYKGRITMTGIADRIIDTPPFFVEFGHILPSVANPRLIEKVKEVFKAAIKALGIENGAAKGDIRIFQDEIFIGEVAARLSGGFMSGFTYPYATGVNLMEAIVNIHLGQAPGDLTEKKQHTAYEYTIPAEPGEVSDIRGVKDAMKIKNIKDIIIHVKRGDIIEKPQNNVQKAGSVIAVAPTRPLAAKAVQKALETVKITTKSKHKGSFYEKEKTMAS